MHFLTVFTFLLTTLINPAIASPQLLGNLGAAVGQLLSLILLLSTPPPTALMTKEPSPECANVNKGALLCCQSSFQGDIPISVQTAPLVAYKLNPNSNNCIYGIYRTRNFTDCSRGVELCFQVDALATTLMKSALDIFTRSSSQRAQGPKPLAWDSFVDAMGKVGFVARKSSGGSAFTFQPTENSKWFAEDSIAYHRPHPVPILDQVMLLDIGKRMRKQFGWGKDAFELEK